MYERLRDVATHVLKVRLDPPAAPPGDHSVLQTFRASEAWLRYRLTLVAAAIAAEAFGFVLGDTAIGTAITHRGAPEWVGVLFFVGSLVAFAGLLAWAALQYVLVRLDYDLRYYLVTDRSLRVREGALVVRENTVTFANVQNVRLVQGPLMRVFGLWDLVVDTAGGGGGAQPGESDLAGHSARLKGLTDPGSVRVLILDRLRRERGTGLGDPDDAQAPRARFAASHVSMLREIRTELAGVTQRL